MVMAFTYKANGFFPIKRTIGTRKYNMYKNFVVYFKITVTTSIHFLEKYLGISVCC